MTLKSILLFVAAEGADATCGAPAFAVALAKAHGAALTIFAVALDVTSPGPAADAAALANAIADAAHGAGVDSHIVATHSHAIGVHEVVAEHARLHDITVTGCRSGAILGERQIAEHLLFDSGRPVIIVPADHDGAGIAGPVAAAWDNSRSAARALGDARDLMSEGAILITIDGDKQIAGDLDSAGLTAALARRGITARHVSADKGARTIAAALQDEARAHGATLLAMGGFGHSRLRSFVLGSATEQILDRPAMPVLLSH